MDYYRLDGQVLSALYLSRFVYGRYPRFNEILKITEIKKTNLQWILKRLIKRGWVEKIKLRKFYGYKTIVFPYIRGHVEAPIGYRRYWKRIAKHTRLILNRLREKNPMLSGLDESQIKIIITERGKQTSTVTKRAKIIGVRDESYIIRFYRSRIKRLIDKKDIVLIPPKPNKQT